MTLLKKTNSLSAARLWSELPAEVATRRLLQALQQRDPDTLVSLVEAYVTQQRGVPSRSSRQLYKRAVELFLENCQDNLVRLSAREAALYIRALEEGSFLKRAYARATVSAHRSALKVLYDALIDYGAYRAAGKQWQPANPFGKVRLSSQGKHEEAQRGGVYSDNELRALLLEAEPAMKLALLLGAHGGLRVSEMLALRNDDVNTLGGTLVVRSGKRGKRRTVRMTRTLKHFVGEVGLPLPYSHRTYLHKKLKEVAQAAGVAAQGKGVHALRHYCGCKLYQASKDIYAVKRFLGHSSVDTSERYVHPDGAFDETYQEEFKAVLGID